MWDDYWFFYVDTLFGFNSLLVWFEPYAFGFGHIGFVKAYLPWNISFARLMLAWKNFPARPICLGRFIDVLKVGFIIYL